MVPRHFLPQISPTPKDQARLEMVFGEYGLDHGLKSQVELVLKLTIAIY